MNTANWSHIFLIVALLGLCNFLPILAHFLLKDRFSHPIDLGRIRWFDGAHLFGPHKTWRGLVISVLGTTTAASLTPIGPLLGGKLAALSLLGDLMSSFIKRRRGLKSGHMALGLDQGAESFIPLWVLKTDLAVTWGEIGIVVLMFTVIDLILSPILFRLHIRRFPF